MVDLPQLNAPGEIWHYNNAGFYVAGRIIEVITGKPYETALRELLLEPLGMTHSFFMPGEVMIHRFAVGHIIDGDQVSVAEPWGLARAVNPVGGLNSCAQDMLRYARFHLGDGTGPDGARLLSKDKLEFMRSALSQVGHAADAVGVSWMLKQSGEVMLVSHGGATNGQQAAFVFAPARDFALVVLTNSSRGSELHREISDWTLNRYLGITKTKPDIQAMTESALAEYVGDYEAALTKYEIRLEDGELILQARPKGGFPNKDSKPGPTPPSARIGFVAEDRIVGLDWHIKGLPGEFLRDGEGKIVWFRFGSRIHARQD
jgi:CubicO group peptidase (beta-lactamase class C family)